MKLFLTKLLGFIRTGHWPKKFRYPNGIPRVPANGREHG